MSVTIRHGAPADAGVLATIAFYPKAGFVDVGSHTVIVGRDAQTDRVMVRPLPSM